MWLPKSRQIAFGGTITVSMGTISPPVELKGVTVEVYRFEQDAYGQFSFDLITPVSEKTDPSGGYDYSGLPVSVLTQTVIPNTPPNTPVELVHPGSLPNLAFRILVEASILGITTPGVQFVTVYDEREIVNAEWMAIHPERMHVPLTGSPPLNVLIPEDVEEALIIAGLSTYTTPFVPGSQVHLLRIGRVLRQEIGEFGDPRPEYVDKAGYMTSSNLWSSSPEPSFFGGQYDAPFAGVLHIGGHFGSNVMAIPNEDLYYTISVSRYTGAPGDPFDDALLVDTTYISDSLFNKRYILPTAALPKGKWETLHLGPFEGEFSGDVEQIYYKRPPQADDLTEYWPFHDLLAIWNTAGTPNERVVLNIEIYERTGGTTIPVLGKFATDTSVNQHLPLVVDNRPPVPKYKPYNSAVPEEVFYTAFSEFLGVAESVTPTGGLGECNEFEVHPSDPTGNESLLAKYSVEDGAGSAHQHLKHYGLSVEYTPRGSAGSVYIPLKANFNSVVDVHGDPIYEPISKSYAPTLTPILVTDYKSVIVPSITDSWPPEYGGTDPTPCVQYAMEVSLSCSVRTINGWGHRFGTRHTSRHIIIKRPAP